MDSTSPPPTAPAPPIALRWQWSRMPGLPAADVYAALVARQQVFVVEQNCTFLDADGHDPFAWHLLGWTGDHGAPTLVAYLRVLDPGRKFAEPSIGRVLTTLPHRGTGLGRVLMIEGIARTRLVWRAHAIRIAAQQQLEPFYTSLGFRTVSAPYNEDDILHVDMRLDAAAGL